MRSLAARVSVGIVPFFCRGSSGVAPRLVVEFFSRARYKLPVGASSSLIGLRCARMRVDRKKRIAELARGSKMTQHRSLVPTVFSAHEWVVRRLSHASTSKAGRIAQTTPREVARYPEARSSRSPLESFVLGEGGRLRWPVRAGAPRPAPSPAEGASSIEARAGSVALGDTRENLLQKHRASLLALSLSGDERQRFPQFVER